MSQLIGGEEGGSVSTLGLRSEYNETMGEKLRTSKFIVLKCSKKENVQIIFLIFPVFYDGNNTKNQNIIKFMLYSFS
jgi:hypothetical protein